VRTGSTFKSKGVFSTKKQWRLVGQKNKNTNTNTIFTKKKKVMEHCLAREIRKGDCEKFDTLSISQK